MERPMMNKGSQISGPVERSDTQLKILKIRQMRACIRAGGRHSSRTYEQHHFPGPALVSCKSLMCRDQETAVVHRFCSKWRPLVCTDTRMAYLTDFQDFLPGYLSVPQGHFFGIIYSSWDTPSIGIH